MGRPPFERLMTEQRYLREPVRRGDSVALGFDDPRDHAVYIAARRHAADCERPEKDERYQQREYEGCQKIPSPRIDNGEEALIERPDRDTEDECPAERAQEAAQNPQPEEDENAGQDQPGNALVRGAPRGADSLVSR